MKRVIVVAALAVLAACSKPAEAPAEPAAEASAEAAPAAVTLAADGKPSTGTFKVTRKDGTTYSTEVKPDGTYSVVAADGKVMETGKWEQKSSESYCETADKEGAKQKCFVEKVDDKGIYTSTDPENGEVSTIVRVEGSARTFMPSPLQGRGLGEGNLELSAPLSTSANPRCSKAFVPLP